MLRTNFWHIRQKQRILSSVAYEVTLGKMELDSYGDYVWAVYDSEIVYNLKEAKDVAMRFVRQVSNKRDLYIVNIYKGMENLRKGVSDFNSDSIFAIANKSENEVERVLGEEEFNKLSYETQTFYTDCGKTKLW